ncbi:hypothetical protein B0H13DRAFT_2398846 [Mycena leptocephala]|nr:hypothetical protein B0H13DRAFT_2398846 [Mycena leptocephala]
MSPPFDASTPIDDESLFNYLAWSQKEIRTKRSNITTFCSACFKSDKVLVSDSELARAQTDVWRSGHPEARSDPDVESDLARAPALVLHPNFDLLHRPRCDELLLARLDVAVEPSDIVDFADIFLGEASSEKKLQGMLQVNAFTLPTDPRRFSPERRAVWRSNRAIADSAGFNADPVAIMDVVYADGQNSLTIPLRIRSAVRKVVTMGISEGFAIASGITGETTRVPYTVENCLQFINTHIRADKSNQLLLRTEMRPSDIQIVRDAATNSNSVPAMILHAKIAREYIYESIYQAFLQRRRAATGAIPSIPVLKLL